MFLFYSGLLVFEMNTFTLDSIPKESICIKIEFIFELRVFKSLSFFFSYYRALYEFKRGKWSVRNGRFL